MCDMRMVGDRVGHNWRMPNIRGRRAVRHVIFDTNYWKSFVASRLLTPMGDRGNLSLWGRETERHMLFAEHLTAEYRVKAEGRGRKVDEWRRAHLRIVHWNSCRHQLIQHSHRIPDECGDECLEPLARPVLSRSLEPPLELRALRHHGVASDWEPKFCCERVVHVSPVVSEVLC